MVSSIRLSGMFILFAWLFLSVVSPSAAQAADGYILQGLVGAGTFDSDSLTFRLTPEESGEEEDLSSMPFLGFIGQHLFAGDRSQLGVEGGILFGWRSRSTSAVIGSNQARVRIESSFWLLDLSAGVCLNQRFGQRWRLYLAAGPAMVFGEYDEDDYSSAAEGDVEPTVGDTAGGGSESEFGVGGYARVGLEYEFAPQSLVGFSVRGLATNMEFDNTVDSSKVNGVQAFVTFTRNFGR